jgi:hypothetical protein
MELHLMTDVRERLGEFRSREALIEKVAEAIRQAAVMKMEEGEDLALYVAEIWRTYARAALATIEAERYLSAPTEDYIDGMLAGPLARALVEALLAYRAVLGQDYNGNEEAAWLKALEPFERTLGSTRNEIPQSGGLSQ